MALALTQVFAQSPNQAPPATNSAQPASGEEAVSTPIYTVTPKYPKEARKQKKHGTVVLQVKVGEDGKVKDLSIVSGDPDLAAAATQAVKKWRYQPYVVDGKATAVERDVTVNFRSSEDFDKQIDERIAAGERFRMGPGITPPKLRVTAEQPDICRQ